MHFLQRISLQSFSSPACRRAFTRLRASLAEHFSLGRIAAFTCAQTHSHCFQYEWSKPVSPTCDADGKGTVYIAFASVERLTAGCMCVWARFLRDDIVPRSADRFVRYMRGGCCCKPPVCVCGFPWFPAGFYSLRAPADPPRRAGRIGGCAARLRPQRTPKDSDGSHRKETPHLSAYRPRLTRLTRVGR